MSEQETTAQLLKGRESVYGERVDNMARCAAIWSALIGHTIQPVQVPLMMAGYKLLRASMTPDYSDNVDDVDGYVEMAREVVGEDMIHARTVSEYLELKEARERGHFEREFSAMKGRGKANG